MDPVEVELSIHDHPLTPLRDNRRGDCCGIKFEAISDGYYCTKCDFFFHKKCSNPPRWIKHPTHKCPQSFGLAYHLEKCSICTEKDVKVYKCWDCKHTIDLDCIKYAPPEVIDIPHNHDHKLKLETVESCFTCTACGKDGNGYSYKCHECQLSFHVSCQKYAAELKHPSHSLHPLKLFNGEPPAYTDGTCRLCAKKIVDEAFYHCSLCKFTLDLDCVQNPPPLTHHDPNTHEHKLTLMPKLISFTCTTCGLNGDRSPYVCLQCDFMAHNDCSGFPWVIYINRHDHRVSRTSLLGEVNSVCGVCQKKMDWSCGGYFCQRCPSKVVHTKCATREDVWDGLEMKDEPEEDEDIEPFKVIDDNTIQHFGHEEHYLRLDKSGIFIEGRSCEACNYPIYHDPFYNCMSCSFMLHEGCANFPKRKRHMASNKPYTLHTSQPNYSKCRACGVIYNGFMYHTDPRGICVRCASVTEPFAHQSHPHPLFYTTPKGVCTVCTREASHVLRCVKDDCGYVLDFSCALLPYKVKNRVDRHFLSLCYGENASGKYWCDICEKETNPKTWFYTCKDCGVTLHINCVLGIELEGLKVGTKITTFTDDTYEVVSNNTMSRPSCTECMSRCIFPIILKEYYSSYDTDTYFCSIYCCHMYVERFS